LFIPDIVLGISLLLLLGTVVCLVAGGGGAGTSSGLRALFLTVLIARFEGFDKNLEEASADLGENGWMTFWRVTLPLMLPGIIASLLLTFITSFDEFLVAYFLSGTEATLPIYIWGQLRFPERPADGAGAGRHHSDRVGGAGDLAEYVRNRGVQKPMVGA
jgi:spermidine/putrescine transport system permease protein